LGDIPAIYCNLGQLNQVFMNLLVNAAQAMDSQGEITVKTSCDDKNVYIAVSDTGKGIPEDKINRIFEPFFTTKEVGKGTGLGLSIAYDIVRQHHGVIHVESEVGKGTTFTISLPIADPMAAQA
jgi:signal transduction histidine kinase